MRIAAIGAGCGERTADGFSEVPRRLDAGNTVE